VNNPYRILGIILAVAGALIAPVFYFVVGSVPLASVAVSAIILGLTCLFLANARPYISPEACQTLLKTGEENTAALLEELNLRTRAVYLPSDRRGGHSQALVPLASDVDFQHLREKLPGRLIVRYGPNNDQMAVAVTTVGGVNLDLLPSKPGPSADEIESALNYLYTGVLDIAKGVAVNLSGSQITVAVSGAKMGSDNVWYYQCLGSPLASIAAAVVSEALDRPVRITGESTHNGRSQIGLEVLP